MCPAGKMHLTNVTCTSVQVHASLAHMYTDGHVVFYMVVFNIHVKTQCT